MFRKAKCIKCGIELTCLEENAKIMETRGCAICNEDDDFVIGVLK